MEGGCRAALLGTSCDAILLLASCSALPFDWLGPLPRPLRMEIMWVPGRLEHQLSSLRFSDSQPSRSETRLVRSGVECLGGRSAGPLTGNVGFGAVLVSRKSAAAVAS